MNTMLATLAELSDLTAISSREGSVASHVRARFSDTPWSVETDAIGNITLRHRSWARGAKTILVFAHMDEVGMIARKIEPNGFIRFERIGGVNTQVLPGTRVVLAAEGGTLLPGVVGTQAHHFMPPENKFCVTPLAGQYIDAFVRSADELAELGVGVGTLIGFAPHFEVVRERYVCGKSMDNRMAMSVLYGLGRTLANVELPYNLAICFPVMEEFNIRGLLPVVRRLAPSACIGLDITPACDTPDLDYTDIALGKGPDICCMNFHGGGTLAGVLPNEGLFCALVAAANAAHVNLQREISPGVITENAFSLFEGEGGMRVANLSIPTRYTHTPNETACITDIKELGMLLERFFRHEALAYLKGLDGACEKKGEGA